MNAPRFTSASTFDTSKGSGPDDLHPFMLQVLADFLAEPITALCNKSLQSAEVPDFQKGGLGGRGLLLRCEFNFCFV